MDELRKKTATGSLWVLFERFGYLGIQFVSNIVLSRLLMPDDFGTIGVLMVFTTLSYVLIDSGLSSALIQKKNISEEDKSTVFFTNLAFAIIVYVVIYFTAPLIAEYFKNPEINNLLRIIELIVVIDAFAAIQSTTLTRDMDFKTLAKYKIISIVIAASVSIVLAYAGMGVWSLVVQYLLFSLCRALLLWLRTKWRPRFVFCKFSFKSLFSYGSKLLLSRFIAELYNQFQSFLSVDTMLQKTWDIIRRPDN
jgi:O-antigen/teichoic acid export membrane protein